MSSEARPPVTPQLVLGLSVIALGLIFTLDNFEVIHARSALRFWPVALIAVGVSHMTGERVTPRRLIGVPWILVGTLILLRNLGLFHVHIADLWPIVLIVIGGYLVLRAFDRRPSATTDSSASVTGFAFMSGLQRRISSSAFRGGELTAVMGGVELDLRQADLSDGEATLDVFAMWGGIKLKVPEDWVVVGKVAPLMGGYVDKTRPPKHDGRRRLVVRGMAFMGGIEVVN